MDAILSSQEVAASCDAARQKIESIYAKCLANQLQLHQFNGNETETTIQRLQKEVEEWNKEYTDEIERIRLEYSRFMKQYEVIKANVSAFKDKLETCLDRFNQLTSIDSRTESEDTELRQLLREMEGFRIREKEINELKTECGMIQGQFLLFSDYLKDKGLLY
jgi:chromosome segregation ATPase